VGLRCGAGACAGAALLLLTLRLPLLALAFLMQGVQGCARDWRASARVHSPPSAGCYWEPLRRLWLAQVPAPFWRACSTPPIPGPFGVSWLPFARIAGGVGLAAPR
jgi:hypothetical protein